MMAGEREVELWLPIRGFDGLYEVSSHGRVRSLDHIGFGRYRRDGSQTARIRKGRILKPNVVMGYLQVSLCRAGRANYRKVHRLVCEAFHGPAPEGKTHVAHWDRDPSHNYYRNLRWADRMDNEEDKKRHQSHQKGSGHAHANLVEEQVEEIFRRYWVIKRAHPRMVPKGTLVSLAGEFETTPYVVESIIHRKSWRHVTDRAALS